MPVGRRDRTLASIADHRTADCKRRCWTKPEIPALPELTRRAVLTGMLLGALLTPCNVYSGLKIGWSFNMSIAAGLLGFAFWQALAPLGVRGLGLHENNINQTTASSAASIISSGLVAPIPALTLVTGRTLPFTLLALWVVAVSVLGIVVAAGLRNQMLLRERLPFPAGVATAETMRHIHASGAEATARVRLLLGAGALAGTVKLIDTLRYALPRPALPVTLPGGAGTGQLGFVLDPSLLMLGFGAIIGLRAGLSLLFGALLAWGGLAPLVLARDWLPSPPDPAAERWFGPLVEWLLWPGVSLMIVAALTSFAISLGHLYCRRRQRRGHEPAPAILSPRAFVLALAVALVVVILAQMRIFEISWWAAELAALLSFVLAVVAARVSGETGITPIGAMGNMTQLAYGAITPGDLTANLMSANVTGGAAGQCADLMHDLRTGQIIGATARLQLLAQVFGVLVGSLVGSLVYLLLIPDPATMLVTAEWPAPAVATWAAMAQVLAEGWSAAPTGAPVGAVIAGGAGLVLALAERLAPTRFARWLPSAPALGLAFIIPAWNSLTLCLGAGLAAALWRLRPAWAERRTITLAAGLVAGESLAGVAIATGRMIG